MNTTRVRTKGWLFDSMAFSLALASVLTLLAIASPSQLSASQPRQDSTVQVESEDLANEGTREGFGQEAYDSAASSSSFFRLPHTSEIAWVLLTVSAFFCGYSLITAGKKGVGWITISMLIAVMAILAKLVLSMFVEVTTQYSPPDWDEE